MGGGSGQWSVVGGQLAFASGATELGRLNDTADALDGADIRLEKQLAEPSEDG